MKFISIFLRGGDASPVVARVTCGILVLLASVCSAAVAVQEFIFEDSIPNLSRSEKSVRESLVRDWDDGKLVVLIRHVERCDRSEYPCLSDKEGITARGASVAAQIGGSYKALGLAATDIYTSSVTRAVQSSTYMFNPAIPQLDWLFNCKKTDFVDSIVKLKKPGRNLVLVTHSECMNSLEEKLGVSSSGSPQYGASVFMRLVDSRNKPAMIGYLNSTELSEAIELR